MSLLPRRWPVMHSRSLFSRFLRLAVPVSLQSMVGALYGVVDMYMVGHLGSSAVAAVGLASSFIGVLFLVLVALTTQMAQVTLQEGLDSDGAIFNELRDRHLLDTDRVWWVQAEGMVGFFNAYLKSLNPAFHKAALDCWHIINQQLIDKNNGEWYWKTYRDGRPYLDRAKVEPWKCPYHNGRACLELIERLSGFEES